MEQYNSAEATKYRQSLSHQGGRNGMFNKRHTEETKAKIAQSMKKRWAKLKTIPNLEGIEEWIYLDVDNDISSAIKLLSDKGIKTINTFRKCVINIILLIINEIIEIITVCCIYDYYF